MASSSMTAEKLVITVKEARKILAEEASELSDEDIYGLLQSMQELASYGLRIASVRKSEVVK